jgi:hypothetical protein
MATALEFLTQTEAAHRLGIAPRVIGDALHRGKLDPKDFPLLGTRRVVPIAMLDTLRRVLTRKSKRK